MKTKLLLFPILLFLISCDGSTDPNSDNFDISLQEDIEWNSLADTPWPMNHGNPQSNGRSPFVGPKLGQILNKIPYYGIESSLAIGKNNEILIPTAYDPRKFSAIQISGGMIWEVGSAGTASTPLVADSAIYWGNADGLSALNFDGSIKWEYKDEFEIWNIGINIDPEGIVYFVTLDRVLKAVSPKGKLLWELKDERFRGDAHGAPTFSPDGKTLYVQGTDVSALAVDIESRKVKWVFGDEELFSSPVIDYQGNIYFIPGGWTQDTKTIYSLDENGNINWTFDFDDETVFDNTEPAIDYDGNIFFGGSYLYFINHNGELRWKLELDSLQIISPLVCDAEGNIFVGTSNLNDPSTQTVISFDNNGIKNWELVIEGERQLGASPAITSNGKLIFPTFRAWNILVIN